MLVLILTCLSFSFQSCEDRSKPKEIQEAKKSDAATKKVIPTDEIVNEFYDAIFDKDNQKVSQMLGTSFPADYLPKNKISPLQALIWSSDDADLAKQLIEGGANFNSKDNPAVLIACEYKRLETLKYLIAKGSDIKQTEAFNKAGFYQFYEGAKVLLLKGANQEKGDIRGKIWVYEQAVTKSDYEVLKALKLTKEEINQHSCDGETALIIAVKQNNPKMVEYLIKRGANKNKPETFDCGDDIHYGKTPIQIAKEHNFREIAALIE
ncbi:ankyrin repeat domain-containing protein [Pedobacter xixiisoli]|uniref:Ankyrin repeat-containing protein n=2 Tax=Pedobacter xixiisoli TaxID=1476464 RepID=A0A286ADJ8_9SPHI|nr:ankyrin repeat domain-containing protein [Pedobacter xixiisoli]SOD19945.1 Ankyrin repeat-containing protein [Pedobacter xixiisoli]